ncbi:MAG: hypothetical protein PHE49_11145, partial [bacterium]|nr:hypothetical protein [bacterium]
MKRFKIFGIATCFLFTVNALGVNTELWEVKDFAKCKLNNIMLDENGNPSIAPAIKELWKNPELYIWSIIKSGNTIYVGTGGKGKVYKINTSNKSGSELSLLD